MHTGCGEFVALMSSGVAVSWLVRNASRLYRDFRDCITQSCIHQLTNAVVCKRRDAYGLMFMQALLTVDQPAQCLRKSVASVRSDATRNPQSLPPLCRLPGTKRLLWRVEDVEAWLGAHVTSSVDTTVSTDISPMPRRGRPTKAEQIMRQRLEASATRSTKSSTRSPEF